MLFYPATLKLIYYREFLVFVWYLTGCDALTCAVSWSPILLLLWAY